MNVEIYHDQVLGVGSYGKVCKAKYGQLPCAAKLLHDTMFEGGDTGISKFLERFEQECQFLSMIKHPNIVQYLGTSRNPKSQRLALLMELMNESLTRFLERSTGPLPYHIQLDICHDVALALSYLHSNTIIHRDLSSNNVLLIGDGNRAKVTDFGMSKLTDINPHMTPLTTCPGSQVYMPPEALTTPPHYSEKLDCFSHGVLTVQILTRNFPKPGDAHQSVEDTNNLSRPVILPTLETERRKEDIDLIDPTHPLLPPALNCLHNRATERPSADEVCERLATLKREERYTHCVEQTRDQASLIQTLRGELAKQQEIISHERASHESEMKDQASLIKTLTKQLEQKDEFIQQERAAHKREARRDLVSIQKVPALIWTQEASAPCCFRQAQGAATVHGNTVYFSNDYDIYSYSLSDKKWTQLPQCRYWQFAMAVIDNKLTTIGGQKSFSEKLIGSIKKDFWWDTRASDKKDTSNLLSLLNGQWEKFFPPMAVSRVLPTVVSTDTYLVVFGGCQCDLAIEVLNINTRQWTSIADSHEIIEQVLRTPPIQMTICSGKLYGIGNTVMLWCSFEDLLKYCRPTLPLYVLEGGKSIRPSTPGDGGPVWTLRKRLPVSATTIVTVNEHILAIGGLIDTRPSADIYDYDQISNTWNVIGRLPSPRWDVQAAVLSNNVAVVVGGYREGGYKSYDTFIMTPSSCV